MRKLIRKILNEEISSQVRRRIPTFEETFKHYRKAFIDYKIRNFEIYWNLIMETVSETLYHAWFINTVPDNDWDKSEKFIQDYLTKNYHNETEKMWEKKHRKRLNESKTPNYPKLINDILSSYKEEDFICDIDVSYYNEVYEIAVKINKKEFEKKYENIDINYATILMTGYLDRLKRNITRDIKTLLPVDVLVWFRQINCDKKINESEDNEGLYLSMIKDIVDPYKTENGVCDIDVNYDQEDDMYTVMVNFGLKQLDKTFHPVRSLQREWHVEDIRNKVKNEILGLLPIENIYVGSTAVENCNETINESEDKKSTLLSIIEENGLYELISYTGLHINEVEQMVGQLSREVLERFIIDVLKEHSHNSVEQSQTYVIDLDSWPLDPVPVGNNDYVERIRVTNNELSFTVMLYEEDEYGDLEETSWEVIPSNNLEYDNIYEIAGQLCYYLVKGQL